MKMTWTVLQHKHSLARSLACQFRFVVRNKSHTVFSGLWSLTDNRWRHKMYKSCTAKQLATLVVPLCIFEHFMTSSVINRELKQTGTTTPTVGGKKYISSQSSYFTEHIFTLVSVYFSLSLKFRWLMRLLQNEAMDVKVMLHGTIFNDDFSRTMLREKST